MNRSVFENLQQAIATRLRSASLDVFIVALARPEHFPAQLATATREREDNFPLIRPVVAAKIDVTGEGDVAPAVEEDLLLPQFLGALHVLLIFNHFFFRS